MFQSPSNITLVGGGALGHGDLALARGHAPVLVAADGGANHLAHAGHVPECIIGDLDSLAPELRRKWASRLIEISAQDSTDFDKALGQITAPLILAVGFCGGRLDHMLGNMSSLVRHGSSRVVVLGAEDVCFLAPPHLALTLERGARVSLFPMGPVTGRSCGLHWPIAGLEFAPSGQIGTSNHADQAEIVLEFDAPLMLVLLARGYLAQVLQAVTSAADWPESDVRAR